MAECRICLFGYAGEEVFFLECRHVFHTECLRSLLKFEFKKCPYCGMEMSEKVQESVQNAIIDSQMFKKGKSIRYGDIDNKFIPGKLIVTEKIHGSNIAIGYINNSLWLQSRNEIIPKFSTKFNLNNIIDRLIEIVHPLQNKIQCNFLIYGEIFGHMKKTEMNYHDPESEKVFGSNVTFFRAFDLYETDRDIFWKYSDAIKIFEEIGLPYVPILDITYKNISDLYSEVEKYKSAYSNDIVEGFVLKKDSMQSSSKRDIFKIKREKFCDKHSGPEKYKVKNYVTDNRYSSANSKVGNDLDLIKEEMINDIMKDMMTVLKNDVKMHVEKYISKRFKLN